MTVHSNRWDYRKVSYKKARLRAEAIIGFECTCQYCDGVGNEIYGPDGKPWHLDRLMPGVLGGKYEPDNVVLACSYCNISKGGKTSDQKPEWDAALPLGALFHMWATTTFLEPLH